MSNNGLTREMTRDAGVGLVSENVGFSTWGESIASLAKGGRLVTFGISTCSGRRELDRALLRPSPASCAKSPNAGGDAGGRWLALYGSPSSQGLFQLRQHSLFCAGNPPPEAKESTG